MTRSRLLVWQWPVRLLHWLLVVAVVGSWLTRSKIGEVHQYWGYAAAVVVVLRLFWSLLGNRYSRFGHFVHGARPTWEYLRTVLTSHAPRYLGHNPLGGWMVVALLCCLATLTLTGLLYTTDRFWGEGWLADLHAGLGWLLLGLVALHIGGVLFTSWQHRENLVLAMLTGRKDAPRDGDID